MRSPNIIFCSAPHLSSSRRQLAVASTEGHRPSGGTNTCRMGARPGTYGAGRSKAGSMAGGFANLLCLMCPSLISASRGCANRPPISPSMLRRLTSGRVVGVGASVCDESLEPCGSWKLRGGPLLSPCCEWTLIEAMEPGRSELIELKDRCDA